MLRILSATDLSQQAHVAFMRAIQLATAHDAWLRVVHASRAELGEDDKARIRSLSDRLRALTPPDLHAHVAVNRNDPLDALLEEVTTFDPDLNVIGAHKRARFRDALFGSLAARLVASTNVPLLVARAPGCRPYRRVLAAVDDDETAEPVLQLAARVGSASDVFVVHARPPADVGGSLERDLDERDAHDALERTVRRVLPRSDERQVHLEIRRSDPFRVIERELRQIEPDLLVLGTHGRSGVERILFESIAADSLACLDLDTVIVRVGKVADAAIAQPYVINAPGMPS